MRIDVHQHLWTAPLVDALADRRELPFVRRERDVSVLYCAGERPYVLADEAPARRAELVASDGLDGALVSLSSVIGVESLPGAEARELLDCYHDSALALDAPFGVWAALPLTDSNPADVQRALQRGCVGVSVPAGALASGERLARLQPVLERLEALGAPLFVHPGDGPRSDGQAPAPTPSLGEPLWWPALTRYVAQMHAAWLAIATAGRPAHPRLVVVFAMLAGLAPLHAERLLVRGGPRVDLHDPLAFYDTSSYGAAAVASLQRAVGPQQLLYGSDRPVVDPAEQGLSARLDWDAIAQATRRAFHGTALEALR